MRTKSITIGTRTVGAGLPVFFIAEVGVNHNGDVARAKRLIDAAVEAGADAVKFQTFTAERLNTRQAPKARYHVETTGPDEKQSWFDLLKSQELTPAMHHELMDYCRQKRIIFLSTPYDEESADFLETLDVPAFKLASTDANNIPFLRHLARKGRPILLSTGMCTMQEVRESVETIRKEGLEELVVLHCTANYPASLPETHLRAMVTIGNELEVLVGYSDHTMEHVNPILAVAMGAVVYEKHITEDRQLPGPDHRISLTPDELKDTIRLIRRSEIALGSAKKRVLESELENRTKLRKSLVAKNALKKGQIVGRTDVIAKRPGDGLAPSMLESIIGRQLKCDLDKDEKFEAGNLE